MGCAIWGHADVVVLFMVDCETSLHTEELFLFSFFLIHLTFVICAHPVLLSLVQCLLQQFIFHTLNNLSSDPNATSRLKKKNLRSFVNL